MGKRKTMDDIADELVRAMQQPEPADWSHFYTPEKAAAYGEELGLLEAELDAGWPEWRNKKPFGHLPKDKIAWIKVRLKRRDLIVRGNGAYGVKLVYKGDMPMAIPVVPRALRGESFRPVVSVPMLARHLGERVDDVQKALAVVPDGERAVASWVSSYLQQRRASPVEASPHAPSPPPAAAPTPGEEGGAE